MRPPKQAMAILAVVALLVAACVARAQGTPEAGPPRIAVITPLATALNDPGAMSAAVDTDALSLRIGKATAEAAGQGAKISVTVLDRVTGQELTNDSGHTLATASVVKLFIADDLLLRESEGGPALSPQDRAALDVMLRSSDDDAAERFWSAGGGDAIVTRVAARYGLASTGPGSDGRWWNTISTTSDLVRYYEMLLGGAGGLPPAQTGIIMDDLARSTPTGIDGYPQRFGIPEGLYNEPVSVKQGWMCCIGNDWMHLSTGVIGAQQRYAVAIESLQPSDEATARRTITEAVKTIFPGGRI